MITHNNNKVIKVNPIKALMRVYAVGCMQRLIKLELKWKTFTLAKYKVLKWTMHE